MSRRSPEELDAAIKKWKVTKGDARKVSMRQARLALFQVGLLETVENAILNMPEPQKTIVKIEWDMAHIVDRQSPWINQMASMLGMTSEQMDDLFILASTL